MQNSRKVSGLAGGVALCALVAVLGTSFFTQQMSSILGEDENVNVSRIGTSAGGLKNQVGQGNEDEAYKQAIMEENKRQAEEALARGSSAIPVPIGKTSEETLSVPPAMTQQAADPLQEWRQKAEARRLSVDNGAPQEKGYTGRREGKMAADKKKDRFISDERQRAKERLDSMSRAMQKTIGGAAGAVPMAEADAIAPSSRLVAKPAPEPVPHPVVAPYNAPYYQEQGRESFPDYDDNNVKVTTMEPVSTFSVDVDTSSYSFVRRVINQGQVPPKGAVRLEELINYFPYNYPLPSAEEDPFRPTVAVYKAPWEPEHKLVHIGIKGYDLAEKPPSNLVFLIDTSGSMNSPDKLPLLISSFKLMVDNLGPDDTVGIVTYAGNAGVALQPTKASNKSAILSALDRLNAGGSTAGADGIRTAYELAEKGMLEKGNNRIILATDGDFNVGISNPDELKKFIEKKRNKGVFLSVLGFGRGNYQDATMQALAQNGNGNAAYIDNLSEARKVLVEEAGATLFTIAKDVKIQVEFNPALVQEYRLIGYETRHLNREDFNNDKIDAGEIGAGHTVTAIYEITPRGAKPIVDDLRYNKNEMALVKTPAEDADGSEFSGEYAFLKIRYKKPDADKSILMTRPITTADESDFAKLSDDIRFAASVAAFGQMLRENSHVNGLNWDDIINIANNARGKDEFGYRSEFVNLLRLTKSQSGQGR